jgi:hypothetical protein
MAKATVQKEVTRVVVEKPSAVILELTPDEANILYTILGEFKTGGLTTPIFNALERVQCTRQRLYVRNDGDRAGLLTISE